ncbi:MAG: hypothetical protein IPP49_18895 [Saprospiraceae bacterium]|nr:hypothetical protein [Saprospiraceae bacterium]
MKGCTHGDFIPDQKMQGPLNEARTTNTCEVNDDIWLWYIAAMQMWGFLCQNQIFIHANLMNYNEQRKEFTLNQDEAMDQYSATYRPNLGHFQFMSCSPDPCVPCYYGSPVVDPNLSKIL